MGKTSLRILLIAPRGDFLCRSADFSAFIRENEDIKTILRFWAGTSVNLATIAGLTPPGHQVRLIDENQENIDFDAPVDIVGVSAMTQQAERAYSILQEFKKRGAHTVLGGIHASVLPEEAAKHADSVFVGEAENTWPLFIEDFLLGAPRPLYLHESAAAVDMTRTPVPRYDLLAHHRYAMVWVQTTRGCPHDCEFCAASRVYGRRYKHKDVGQVLEEVKTVKDIWKFAQVGFADDNMFVNREFARELVGRFGDLRFVWNAQTDISIAEDEEFLRLLHANGCRFLFIGLESPEQKNLLGIDSRGWKANMFERYPRAIEAIQREGIGIYGSFIIGLDNDGPDSPDAIIDFVRRTNMMGAQITVLTPFPGSRLRGRLEREGRILTDEWKWYTAWNAVIDHPHYSPEKLESELLRVYKGIYNDQTREERRAYFRKVSNRLVHQ